MTTTVVFETTNVDGVLIDMGDHLVVGDQNDTGVTTTTVNPSSSLFDPSYTFADNQYQCMTSMYYFHIVSCYIVFLSGLIALLSRWLLCRRKPNLKSTIHMWCGRIYIIGMLWSACTGILIHRNGLPTTIMIMFAISNTCLTIGWFAIIIYKTNVNRHALEYLFTKKSRTNEAATNSDITTTTTTSSSSSSSVQLLYNDAVRQVTHCKRTTFCSRIFNLKMLHGVLFFLSWFQMAGRTITSLLSGGFVNYDFKCDTYPIWKPLEMSSKEEDDNGKITIKVVSGRTEDYYEKPWADNELQWCLQIVCTAIIIAVIVAVSVVWKDLRQLQKENHQEQQEQDDDDDDAQQKGEGDYQDGGIEKVDDENHHKHHVHEEEVTESTTAKSYSNDEEQEQEHEP